MISPQFSIGPFTFHVYGFIIAISIYIGWSLAKRRAPIYKIPQKLFDDPILIFPLISALIGARIYHILHNINFYSENPGQILAISSGGLGIWGALVGVIIGFWIVARVKKINLLALLDLLAPSFLLGQAIGRIGNYINQEGFGPPTDLPWGVYISPENRPLQFLSSTHFHPTFFYEALLDLIFFFILLKFSQRSNVKGQMFGLYLILYGIGRFIVEFWRIDTATFGEIKVAHILSVITLSIGLIIFLRFKSIKVLK